MLGSPSGRIKIDDSNFYAAARDISITINPPGENHLQRQRPSAETRNVNDEGAQKVKNLAKQEAKKTELAGTLDLTQRLYTGAFNIRIMHRRRY
jgi:hypothetical protein